MSNEAEQLKANLERGRRDIVFFAWYFLGIKLHPGQIKFLRQADGMVNVLVPGNRFGKTVVLAVRHIWHNFYKIGIPQGDGPDWSRAEYATAALGPNSEVVELDCDTIKLIMTSSFKISREGEPIRMNHCRLTWYILLDKCRNSAPYFIQFKDNSSVEFYSGSDDKFGKVQGRKYGYGSYDEGGRSHHLQYELESNLFPRFGELNAPLDIASTPDQRSPSLRYHYDIFNKGLRKEQGFRSFTGSAYDNVYLPKSYFDRVEKQLEGNPIRDQVIEGKFIFGGISYFMADDISACTSDRREPAPYRDGHKYTIGVDTAMGSDEMVYTVLDDTYDKKTLAAQLAAQGSSKSPQLHMDDFQQLVDRYWHGRNLKILLETWNGDSAHFYQAMPQHYRSITRCWGSWQPNGIMPEAARAMKRIQKEEILIALRKLLAMRNIILPNEQELLDQLSLYREDDKNLKTDRVISLALAAWLATDGKPSHPTMEIINIESW